MQTIDYALEWVENLVMTGAVERSTAADYRACIRSWAPWLQKDVSEVTRRDVERAMREMVAQGRVLSTVRKRVVVMRKVFSDAVDYGDVEKSPFDGVKNPKNHRRERNYLPANERERLKLRIGQLNTKIGVAAALALYAGLREGEICALRASDIDLEAKIGWVRSAVGREGGNFYLKGVKNEHFRDFPIPEPLSLVLGRWIDSNSVRGTSFLLTGTHDFMNPAMLGRQWSTLVAVEGFQGVLGKPPTFHDLRHTYATVAISSGVDVKTVSSVLGHSSAAMTLDVYAVADPVAKRMSAEVLARAI